MERRSHFLIFAIVGSLALVAFTTTVARSEDGTLLRRIAGAAAEPQRGAASGPVPLPGVRTAGKRALHVEASTEVKESSAGESASTGATRGAATPLRISGVPMAGSVTAFALDPADSRAVYIADQATLGRFELYATPLDGSGTPVPLTAGLTFASGSVGVSDFQITPDSLNVVFLADVRAGGGNDDIYSVPIDGSATALRLNDGAEAPVSGFGISADGGSVAFLGVDSVQGSGAVELYHASIGVAGSATQLSAVGSVNPAGDVVAADFSPDGARLVYAADGTTIDDLFQWFSVPVAAGGPGSAVQLSAALSEVGNAAISPDSSTVVYTGDDVSLGVADVNAVPIAGGAAVRLNPTMAGSGAYAVRIVPDGSRVAYLADQDTADVVEVYGAQIGVASSGIRLNAPMAGSQGADTLNVGPDGVTVLYEADQDTAGTFELFAVPVDGSAGPSLLHDLTAPDNVGFFVGLGTPIIGRRAVYPVFGSSVELYAVPFDGGAPFTRINGALDTGDSVRDAFVPAIATRLAAYGVGADSGSVTEQLFVAPIRPDLPVEQVNVSAASGRLGVLGYEVGSAEDYAVYLQDQDTAGKPELYSAALDSDGDAVPNPADSCPFVSNPGQAAVVFGQTIHALSATEFGWSDPAEVRFVRGPLDQVDLLTTDLSGVLADSTVYSDTSTPAGGSGFYYLFADDCAGRSYQTAPGAEPGRDAAGLP